MHQEMYFDELVHSHGSFKRATAFVIPCKISMT